MFSAEQYRSKAAEFRTLLANLLGSAKETSEFRNLEQTYTTLAENEEWMAANVGMTIRKRKNRDNRTGLEQEDEQVLKCGGRNNWGRTPHRTDLSEQYCTDTARTSRLALRKAGARPVRRSARRYSDRRPFFPVSSRET